MSSPLRFAGWLVVGTFLTTACAPDSAAQGYDDPSLTNVSSGGSTASAASAEGPGLTEESSGSTDSGSASGAPSSDPATSPSSSASSAPSSGDPGSGATSPNCDLSGHWMATERAVDEALGVQQAQRHWFYFEFSQSGEQVTATRGLDCGWDVIALSAFSGAADVHKAWPTVLAKSSMAGRKATVQVVASGCSIAFAPYVAAYAMTVPYYDDTSHALPGPNDQASGTSPGWEDWDNDGNPGITNNISGVGTGKVYSAARDTNTWSGTVAATGSAFTVPDVLPKHEEALLGYDGTPLLATQSSVAVDPSLHFVQLARLDATQSAGDDPTVCNTVRTLATTLTPKADEKPLQ